MVEVESMMEHRSGEDELQDLSREDAQELRAFQEKRRWFEGKLKFLEGIPPTYPFVLPTLRPNASDPSAFSYANKASSTYRLPSAEELRTWQAERDSLEEEVLAFDGGDLGRMKEKTREVTLVPLTKAATHAVAITLDLILLIDRLLTLLRQRSDLLELIGLRLQWDGMRWKVMMECASLKEDIKAFVENEGRWKAPELPPVDVKEAVTPVKSSNQWNTAVTPRQQYSALQSPTTSPTINRATSSSSLRTPTSPTTFFSPHSFPSPTPKSHPQTLSARHRALVSTHLKRSSAVLDKMIDIAGPLKGLGGLHGPSVTSQEGKDGGALPDELLDMQDDLETLCEDIRARIGWCKELDEQRDHAEKYYTAVVGSRAQANRVIVELRNALDEPASSAQHQILADLLRQAELSVPAPIDKSLPRPRHPDYPGVESHTAEIANTLAVARSEVKELCAISADGVGWYARLVAGRERLEREDGVLEILISPFREKLELLQSLSRSSVAGGVAEQETYLAQAPPLIAELTTRTPIIERQIQVLEIASTAYKSAMTPPMSIRQALGEARYTDELHLEAEKRIADARTVLRTSADAGLRVKEDIEVLPLSMRLKGELAELETKLGELEGRAREGIDAAAWKQDEAGVGLESGFVGEAQRAMGEIEELHRSVQLAAAELDARKGRGSTDLLGGGGAALRKERLAEVGKRITEVKELVGLLERVERQRTVVLQAEEEAEALLLRLRTFANGEGVDHSEEGDVEERKQVEKLESDVRAWVEGLADRVVFVGPSPMENTNLGPGSDDIPPSKASAVPNIDAGQVSSNRALDLTSLDRRVRAYLNDLTSRVSSALTDILHQRQEAIVESADGVTPSLARPTQDAPTPSMPIKPAEEPDVFGSREPQLRSANSTSTLRQSSTPDSNSPLSQIRQLRKRVRSLAISDLVFPTSAALVRTPSLQRVPSPDLVESLLLVLADVGDQAEKMQQQVAEWAGEEEAKGMRKLKEELETAKAFLPRLEALATFSSRSKACDEVFGRLMDVFDSAEEDESVGAKAGSEDHIAQAKAALSEAEEAALTVETDKRVISDLKRLRAIWTDLSTSLNHSHTPDDALSIVSSEDPTSTPSIPSVPSSPYVSRIPIPVPKPRLVSSLSVRSTASGTSAGTRSTSNPFPRLAMTTESYRNRTVSNSGDAIRRRVDSTSSSKGGMTPRNVSGSALGRDGAVSVTPSRIPRLSAMSPSVVGASARSVSGQGDHARMRKSSMPIPLGSVKGKERDKEVVKGRMSEDRAYVSDPKSTLDQAVGKIVNKLKMSVPIVPVNIAGADEWKDQSGRYWIGAHGRAKLCFCRILRSRTVMVRVGGGWMELSRFLMDHFADALWPTAIEEAGGTAPPPMTPMRNGSTNHGGRYEDTPLPIPNVPRTVQRPVDATSTSSTPSAPLPATSSITSADSPTTPIRKSLIPQGNSGSRGRAPRSSLPLSRSLSFFSPLQSPHTPGSTSGDGAGVGSGPSSPLVPLHFLKKASESPPVREREKERLGAGRRSILGKEG